ncbi:hypothetical protein YC2023_089800 [Brassica napus]|uniref:(rape) hypothetical protein n=1 Tax=Brassica napus TaxID=3708 RepID=A0A816YJ58_BRANA|nr:unnamed protein product [Brassica napus]
MNNLLLRDDDNPKNRKENISIQLLLFSRSLTWMDMDLHLGVSNQTLEQVE